MPLTFYWQPGTVHSYNWFSFGPMGPNLAVYQWEEAYIQWYDVNGNFMQTVSFSPSGSITASYSSSYTSGYAKYYSVTLTVNPPGAGVLNYGYSSVIPPGSTTTSATILYPAAPPGSLNTPLLGLCAGANAGYGFQSWSSSTPSIKLPSSASCAGAIAVIYGGGTITANFCSSPCPTTSTSSSTSTSTTTISWTQSTVPVGTYHVQISYVGIDQRICSSSIWACSWSGSIEDLDTLVAFVIGPTSGGASYPFYIQNCGQDLTWSLSVSTGSYLTVSVIDQNGMAVYIETTLMKNGETLNGSYLTCASTGTTTTVTFPVTLTTTTVTSTTSQLTSTPVTASVTFRVVNKTACGTAGCAYMPYLWVSNQQNPLLNNYESTNHTFTFSLTCNDHVEWKFYLWSPSNPKDAEIVFALKGADGTVFAGDSTSTGKTVFSGRWQPSCAYTSSTSTYTETLALKPIGPMSSISGILLIGFAFVISVVISLRGEAGSERPGAKRAVSDGRFGSSDFS